MLTTLLFLWICQYSSSDMFDEKYCYNSLSLWNAKRRLHSFDNILVFPHNVNEEIWDVILGKVLVYVIWSSCLVPRTGPQLSLFEELMFIYRLSHATLMLRLICQNKLPFISLRVMYSKIWFWLVQHLNAKDTVKTKF